MKSFKDFIKDAKDNFLIWSRLGMASSIRALYDRKTMLKNADISVSLLDKEETNQINIGSKPKVNCQYYQVIGLPQTIAAHIVNDKIDVIVVVCVNNRFAQHSYIETIDGRTLAKKCEASKENGHLILKFDQLVLLPGIKEHCYITIDVGPKTLAWASEFDEDADELHGSTAGSDLKAFATKHGIEPPKDPLEWKNLHRDGVHGAPAILKDL